MNNEKDNKNFNTDVINSVFSDADAIENQRKKEYAKLLNDSTFFSWIGFDISTVENLTYPGYDEDYIRIIERTEQLYNRLSSPLPQGTIHEGYSTLMSRFYDLRMYNNELEHYYWFNFQELPTEMEGIVFKLTEVLFCRIKDFLSK